MSSPPIADALTEESPLGTRRIGPALVVVATVALVLLVTIGLTMAKCGGRFVYTLDDPYIHLALARGIAHGHYGLDLSESSAPSSSILWPFLLAPFARLPLFEFVPLLLNVVFAILSSLAIVACYDEVFRDDAERRNRRTIFWSLATFFAANGVGIALTGMEHGLQIWLTALAAFGLIRVYRGEPMPRSLPVVLAVMPLVRYENLALSLAACAFLALRGMRRTALVAAVVPVAGIVLFSLFLRHEGLGILPSSVMAKSPALARMGGILPPGAVATGAASPSFVAKLTNPANRKEVLFLLLALAFAFAYRSSATKALWTVFAAAVLAHMFLGEFGWAQRYQMYLYVFSLIMLLFLRRQGAAVPLPRLSSPGGWLAVAFAFALISSKSWQALRDSPVAGSAINRQQRQMMSFVRDYYRRPVAVNDLGEVAFGGGQYVLDLWGLASIDALRARLTSKPGMPWMEPVVDGRRIGLVMIYSSFLPVVPASWHVLGRLKTTPPVGFIADDTVTFYATPWADETSLRRQLAEFAPTLPTGARFEITPE